MEADQLGRLRDILKASRLIASYVKDTAEADFLIDVQKQDAVIRRIEIVGEATAHLSNETRLEVPALPFRKMRGMRNIVAHDMRMLTCTLCGRSPPSISPKCVPCWKSSSPRRSKLRRRQRDR